MVVMTKKRDEGPIEILCKEIGFRFDRNLERTDLLVAFVSILVSEISRMRSILDTISTVTNVKPSDDSKEVLELAKLMLKGISVKDLIERASMVHDFIHTNTSEDDYPCDHLVDMISSCASAIRFGLETPCHSRHAASAANHIWKHLYGISLFDQFTSNWESEWARAKFQEAVISLMVENHALRS